MTSNYGDNSIQKLWDIYHKTLLAGNREEASRIMSEIHKHKGRGRHPNICSSCNRRFL